MLYKIDKLFKVSEGFGYPWIYKRSMKCANWTLLLRFHCQTTRGRCTCTWTSLLSKFTEWHGDISQNAQGLQFSITILPGKIRKDKMQPFTSIVRVTKEGINKFLPKYISESFRFTILSPYSSYKNGVSSFRLNSNCQFCSSSSSR